MENCKIKPLMKWSWSVFYKMQAKKKKEKAGRDKVVMTIKHEMPQRMSEHEEAFDI